MQHETLRLFHGSEVQLSPGAHLLPGTHGNLGAGIYFTACASQAAEYGPNIYQCRVEIANPWRITLNADSPLCWAMEFESPALDAICALPNGKELAATAMQHERGHFGRDLTIALQTLGFDSIVGTYSDGSVEVVAFRSDQVRIEQCLRRTPHGVLAPLEPAALAW